MIIHTILFVLFMAVLIREDIAHFEMDFASLAMVALNGTALNIHLGLSPLEMGLGALIWTIAALAVRRFKGRNALGQGDVYLFAVIGLISGPEAAPFAIILFVLISLATSYAYARARGRKMARSLYPAALPGGLTITLILMGQLAYTYAIPRQWMTLFDGFGLPSMPNIGVTGPILTYGPWVALGLAPCAIIVTIWDRHNRDRGTQHG